jgi:predicted Rossmann fold nucleotide-binding protein DprA/Smf involved in DNA uptake
MGAMPYIEQLVKSIDGRIGDLTGEIASLEKARSALIANGSAPSKARRPRRERSSRHKAAGREARRKQKSKQPLLPETAERLLASGDGLSTAALAEQTGASPDQVLSLLRDLEAARRVRRTGQRRATRWHAITDEQRIQERAAELAIRGHGTKRR